MVGGCTVALMIFLMAVIPSTGMANLLAIDFCNYYLLFFSENYFSLVLSLPYALCGYLSESLSKDILHLILVSIVTSG